MYSDNHPVATITKNGAWWGTNIDGIQPASLPLALLALAGIIIVVGTLSMWAVGTVASTRFKMDGLSATPQVSVQGHLTFLGVLIFGLALVAPALIGSN